MTEGAVQTTPCPACSQPSAVRELFRQADRYGTGPVSLGWHGYCRACDVSFPFTAELVQAVLA